MADWTKWLIWILMLPFLVAFMGAIFRVRTGGFLSAYFGVLGAVTVGVVQTVAKTSVELVDHMKSDLEREILLRHDMNSKKIGRGNAEDGNLGKQ